MVQTYTLPQEVDFADGQASQMGSDNYSDYSASSTVTFPTGSADHISTSAGLQTVHAGNQTLNSQIELTTPVPELYLAFWMKYTFDTAVTDDLVNIAGIFNGSTMLFSLILSTTVSRGIVLVQHIFRNSADGSTFRTIGGDLFDERWHHIIMRYKHGASSDGILASWFDDKSLYNESGLTLSSTVNADRAGILVSDHHANNTSTMSFDHVVVSATKPTAGDRANLNRQPGVRHV